MNNDPLVLPEGYSIVPVHALVPAEVNDLRATIGKPPDEEHRWREVFEQALAVPAVREDASGLLVGMGVLSGTLHHAVLDHFVVRREHRGRGIGRVILEQRMDVIEQRDIWRITTRIAKTNSLRDLYIDRYGFVPDGGTWLLLDRIT
jgi:GNAT superfamily N-acetyltransferase